MTPVLLLSAAARDLRKGAEFYSREKSGLGAEFLREFELLADLLANNAELGSPIVGGARKLVFRRFPYMLIYRVEPSQVLILAIAHQRRHPNHWLDRM